MSYAKGSCQCKKVQFQVAMPPAWITHCHCLQCQQIHGAAFATWVGFQTPDFEIIDPDDNFSIYNSGKADRGFCNNCGSSFYFKNSTPDEATQWNGYVYFSRPNIQTPIDRTADEHLHYESHASWVTIQDKLPKN